MKLLPIFRPERRWVLIFALMVMILTTVPYIVGFTMQGDDWRFTGFVFGVEDGNSYIAKMLSGSHGAWLFRSSYTGVLQKGVLAYLIYILSGKIISSTGSHSQFVFLYHFLRFFFGILAIFATYDFLSFFLSDVKLRRFGLVLVILGGGLGWLAIILGGDQIFGTIPLEFYSPESFGFLGLIGFPHLSLARATLLWGMLFYLKFYQSGTEIIASVKLGGLWLMTAIAQPITSVVMGSVIGLHILILFVIQIWQTYRKGVVDWQRWFNGLKLTIIASLIPIPFITYNIFLFTTDEFLIAWTNQNIISSPHPIHYLLAYGICLPFIIFGSMYLLRDRPWTGLLPVLWVLALPLFAYFPVNVQRRLVEGIWVAIVVLTMYAFTTTKENKIDSYQSRANLKSSSTLKYFLCFAFPSTILILIGGLITATRLEPPVFRPAYEVSSFHYLERNTTLGKILLSSYDTSNAVPAWAPMRVVIGHGPESIGLEKLLIDVREFYTLSTLDSWRKQFLTGLEITYVFWGPEERKLGNWDPNQASYLNKIYDQGGYSIFEFTSKTWSND